MNLRLVPCAPSEDAPEVLLTRFPVLVGRSPVANLCLDDRWVSRHHCRLECDCDAFVVRDLGSRHGTLVNGACVEESPLQEGDRLAIGLSTFIVEIPETGETSSQRAPEEAAAR